MLCRQYVLICNGFDIYPIGYYLLFYLLFPVLFWRFFFSHILPHVFELSAFTFSCLLELDGFPRALFPLPFPVYVTYMFPFVFVRSSCYQVRFTYCRISCFPWPLRYCFPWSFLTIGFVGSCLSPAGYFLIVFHWLFDLTISHLGLASLSLFKKAKPVPNSPVSLAHPWQYFQ